MSVITSAIKEKNELVVTGLVRNRCCNLPFKVTIRIGEDGTLTSSTCSCGDASPCRHAVKLYVRSRGKLDILKNQSSHGSS